MRGEVELAHAPRPFAIPDPFRAHFLRRSAIYPTGRVLILPNEHTDALYLVGDGCVRLFVPSPEGAEKTVGYIHPGGVFGDVSLFLGKAFGMTAVVRQRSTIGRLDRTAVLDLLQSHPDLALWCMRQLSWKLWTFGRQIADLAFEKRLGKVANAIVLLARESGEPSPGQGCSLRISQRELAGFAHVSRPNVSEALKELERLGLIRKRFQHIHVPDLRLLQHRCVS